LDARTQQQIDKITMKVLWEAGLKEPPVDVDDVLSHLNLHRGYYDLADPSLGAEIKHALAIGVDRLAGILRRIRFLAATIPDRRQIFIDKTIHKYKQKWATLHEATHNILPWHKAFAYADTAETLDPGFQEQLEEEANYGTKRFLFMGDSFKEMARESKPSLKAVTDLTDLYKTSLESTLRHYVETTEHVPMMLLVCPKWWDTESRHHVRGWRYFVRSAICASMFPALRTEGIMRSIQRQGITAASIDYIEPIQIVAPDLAGNRHQFLIEVLYNGFDIFLLVLPEKRLPFSVLMSRKVV
jgi:hypothetical protein